MKTQIVIALFVTGLTTTLAQGIYPPPLYITNRVYCAIELDSYSTVLQENVKTTINKLDKNGNISPGWSGGDGTTNAYDTYVCNWGAGNQYDYVEYTGDTNSLTGLYLDYTVSRLIGTNWVSEETNRFGPCGLAYVDWYTDFGPGGYITLPVVTSPPDTNMIITLYQQFTVFDPAIGNNYGQCQMSSSITFDPTNTWIEDTPFGFTVPPRSTNSSLYHNQGPSYFFRNYGTNNPLVIGFDYNFYVTNYWYDYTNH